jgi:hypothetical protein
MTLTTKNNPNIVFYFMLNKEIAVSIDVERKELYTSIRTEIIMPLLNRSINQETQYIVKLPRNYSRK